MAKTRTARQDKEQAKTSLHGQQRERLSMDQTIPAKIQLDKIPNYERVDLDSIRRGRRGKHHEILETILSDLQSLPAESAIKIPVAEFGKAGVSRLRSAINRATRSREIPISTHFDGEFFFIWKPAE